MCGTRCVRLAIGSVILAAPFALGQAAGTGPQRIEPYRLESRAGRAYALDARYSEPQLALLEKLNRADRAHLAELPQLVVPEAWDADELAHSPLPKHYAPGAEWPTYLVLHVPGQAFGAYAFGALVRWGPISSGRRSGQTPAGLFALNWRSAGRQSTIDPDWFMRWYFNFDNREGLAFHAYTLPGLPASHGCIRLLERDAKWLYEWGQAGTFDSSGTRVVHIGTPVFIVGQYDFDGAPPWRSLAWLSRTVELPVPPDRVHGVVVSP